jgi:hypothetical protein
MYALAAEATEKDVFVKVAATVWFASCAVTQARKFVYLQRPSIAVHSHKAIEQGGGRGRQEQGIRYHRVAGPRSASTAVTSGLYTTEGRPSLPARGFLG